MLGVCPITAPSSKIIEGGHPLLETLIYGKMLPLHGRIATLSHCYRSGLVAQGFPFLLLWSWGPRAGLMA